MAYPEYIQTRVVSVGGATALESSALLKIQVAIVASRSLIWDATGYRFEKTGHSVESELGNEVQIVLPRTDVAGWKDAATGSIIDVSAEDAYSHRYTATVRFLDANNSVVGAEYTIGPFPIPDGEGAIDLDRMVPASTVAGDAISIPDLWSQLVSQAEAAATSAQAALVDSAQFVADEIGTPGTPARINLEATFAHLDEGVLVIDGEPVGGGGEVDPAEVESIVDARVPGQVTASLAADDAPALAAQAAVDSAVSGLNIYSRPTLSSVLTDLDPESLWRLNETSGDAIDSIGSYDGTVGAAVTRTGDPLAANDVRSFRFPGTGSGLSVAFGDVYSFDSTAAFGVVFAVKPAALAPSTRLISSDNNADGWNVVMQSTGEIYVSRYVSNTTVQVAQSSAIRLEVGKTALIVAGFDGTEGFLFICKDDTVYEIGVDGGVIRTDARTITTGPNNFRIGARADNGTGGPFNGHMSNVAVFADPSELAELGTVTRLYQAMRGILPIEAIPPIPGIPQYLREDSEHDIYALGIRALQHVDPLSGGGSDGNVAIGDDALAEHRRGKHNVAIGLDALAVARDDTGSGDPNVAIYNDTAVGGQAMMSHLAGTDNTAYGHNAMKRRERGYGNTVLGSGSGRGAEDAEPIWTEAVHGQTLVGHNAGRLSHQPYVVAVGEDALKNATTAEETIGIGKNALFNATGDRGTAVGHLAGAQITTGDGNTAIGAQSGGLSGGAGTTATVAGVTLIGEDTQAQADDVVAIGRGARGFHTRSVALGQGTQTTAEDQVMVGARDIEITDATRGVILRAPNGTRHRLTVTNDGSLSTAPVT
ncbi:LamG-like jellyroll fold domain-containing protein [Microbacterium sp. UBA837]|uniref:LamG-like jellyroll fold domain-containing protein n=1 Tax=Microbacterium sp. UBA837 TaxID=1946956 RepID=UPI0025E3D593|nr:LamG-like jellyroll fold domain-containing protein [Microbacterium sp. UBA837]